MRGVQALVAVVVVVTLSACSPAAVREDQANLQKSSRINTDLGLAYLRQHDPERALEKLDKALKENPDNAKANTAIAMVYDALGRTDLAGIHYARAVELNPKDSYALNAYGVYLCQQGHTDEAEREFRAAVANPLYLQPEEALTNAGQCERGRHAMAKAETFFREALKHNPTYPPALFEMARLSYEKGNALSARGYLQRYLAVAKHTPATLWLGIQVERKLGDQNAVASYSMLLKGRFPDSQEARRLQEQDKDQ